MRREKSRKKTPMPRRDFLRVKTSLLERETRRKNWPKKCFGQKISPGGRNLFR
jgi:hypothetical protein